MSDFTKAKLPDNLPQCACFRENLEYAWQRCGTVAQINHSMCEVFSELTKHVNLCPAALMFTVDNAITTLLAYTAKAQNRELKYGSVEIEQATELLLKGMEERVLAFSRYSYESARKYGMTEETVRAMREGKGETRQ